ncbi:MAG: hypothetical protein IPG17_00235 [Sandaracinaceae bacterium]|nr:hypothetical protein [Sandaracinaceae bacterium]MBP7684770.1 hypothetical protein [Deltaproteobacteria bacterium]MBK6811153.1 hypothetical protein [Sandaracinaceae bacterium]MBK7151787.1 hypothetical protein [Sandaracinaceae bacterium]MBK7773247.1 hypothetical protein [Sandaracinaceae bacterium]
MLRVVLTILNVVLAVTYPLAVWWSLTHTSARNTGLLVMLVLIPGIALRLRGKTRSELWPVLRVPLVVLGVLLLGVLLNDPRFVFAMPVLINVGLLITFGSTLRTDLPMIERFARMQDPNLSEAQRAHCRRWTVRWCVFFVVNGSVALALALLADVRSWATYTGGIAYALMGGMFTAEFLERRYRFREYGPGRLLPHDWLLKKVWPPHA